MMFSKHLRAFMEVCVMTKTTCAACDGELGDNPIQVKICGKTVEVCCEDCATKLKEADGFADPRVSLRIARRNFVLGAGTAVAAGLAPTAPAMGRDDMSQRDNAARKASVKTASGAIAYTEQGKGPVALFVHGVLLNGHLWRYQLAALSDIRRCIAPDLLAHGDTEIATAQDVSVTANARMLREFLDTLHIEQVDLVGNDSGGGIAQIFAAHNPQRVRSLALTNCDAHDNWPPKAFKPFLEVAAAGGLPGTLSAMVGDKNIYRSPQALGPAYEHPERVMDETIDVYLKPHLRTAQRTRDLERFLAAFDPSHTVAIEAQLRKLQAPTLIAWGTDDIYFDVKWADWLAAAIPGTRRNVRFEGARIFFPEERWQEFNRELRDHWCAAQATKAETFRSRHGR
jgi:pimeloyl-ACP methyl ester carboxylesterase